MFSHIFIGVSDFTRALAFYVPLMSTLGIKPRFCEPGTPWAAWQSDPCPRPLFIIGSPHDKQPHSCGDGQMTAFLAPSRPVVDRAYAVALENGGSSEGLPGLRPENHENFYGAYFRDPDGNKLCVVCHAEAPNLDCSA